MDEDYAYWFKVKIWLTEAKFSAVGNEWFYSFKADCKRLDRCCRSSCFLYPKN